MLLHNLTFEDAIELALDKSLWRLSAASGDALTWCMPNNDDDDDVDTLAPNWPPMCCCSLTSSIESTQFAWVITSIFSKYFLILELKEYSFCIHF